jgi:hypothetical protein
MASADDPAEMSAGAVNDGISPGGSPRPTPPRAKRRRVEDEEGEPVMSAEEEAYFRGLMQEMLRKPQMQEMLYPYFPETMRNPESFEMLLTDPTYKPVWKEIGVPTLKAFFESHSAPDLPDEILHLIFSRAALDPRGGHARRARRARRVPLLAPSRVQPRAVARHRAQAMGVLRGSRRGRIGRV